MKVDDDSPTHTRNSRNNNDDETKRMEDLKGKGGGRFKHCTVDGDVPLCLRKNQKDSNDDCSGKRKTHSSERIEEMVCELEGYRCDAILLSETWRQDKAEMWETHHKHISMGAGRYDNKHGVGIMLNKKWRQRIIDTEYINERAITTTIVVNCHRIKLMSVYFSHSVYADHHIEKMYKTTEKKSK